jgi:hypothetical protein
MFISYILDQSFQQVILSNPSITSISLSVASSVLVMVSTNCGLGLLVGGRVSQSLGLGFPLYLQIPR